jgi:hypothetical protein
LFGKGAGATAKVNNAAQTSGTTAVNCTQPVTYTLATADGQTTVTWTVTVTLPDNCGGTDPGGKKYITYNEPVTAYYYEYTLFNHNNEYHNAVAYEDKEYATLTGHSDGEIEKEYIAPDGSRLYHNNTWIGSTHGIAADWYTGFEPVTDWASDVYKEKEYPLGEFAAFSVTKSGTPLYEIAASPVYELPDNKEVTEYYIRREQVLEIMCDVYEYEEKSGGVTSVVTWWVDPLTGFTLKMETNTDGTKTYGFEVTRLIDGTPDWDSLHLRPKDGDTYDTGN